MISVLSPAKKLNFEPIQRDCEESQPEYASEAHSLAKVAAKMSELQLSELMGISSNLSKLNKERFLNFSDIPSKGNIKQAAFAFSGDTYKGLNPESIDSENDVFFQKNIRIISGLYGILRPFDMIQAYRLEMGSKLKNCKGKNLYDFWGKILAEELDKSLRDHQFKVIVNLASDEYFKAIDRKSLSATVITPKFYEIKNGEKKLISFFAKKARGAMARFIVINKITDPKYINTFDLDGYRFVKEQSTDTTLIFCRNTMQ